MDQIAELCARPRHGRYDGTCVGWRLAHLFAQPLDQTTRALLAACAFLQIDGAKLDEMNAEPDRRSYGHNPSFNEPAPAEAPARPASRTAPSGAHVGRLWGSD